MSIGKMINAIRMFIIVKYTEYLGVVRDGVSLPLDDQEAVLNTCIDLLKLDEKRSSKNADATANFDIHCLLLATVLGKKLGIVPGDLLVDLGVDMDAIVELLDQELVPDGLMQNPPNLTQAGLVKLVEWLSCCSKAGDFDSSKVVEDAVANELDDSDDECPVAAVTPNSFETPMVMDDKHACAAS